MVKIINQPMTGNRQQLWLFNKQQLRMEKSKKGDTIFSILINCYINFLRPEK